MEKYKFQAKSEDGLLEKALKELNVKEEDVITKTYEEKGGLFSGKKYTLEVVKFSDIAEVGKDVLKELEEFTEDYYDRYSGIYLKSKILLDTIK